MCSWTGGQSRNEAARAHPPGSHLQSARFLCWRATVGPFLWLVSSSFQYERQLLNRPPQWLPNPIVLDSYREIFEGAVLGEASGVPYQSRIFLRSFGNSFVVAGSVAVIAVLAGAYAAYPLARLNFRGRSTLLFGILASRLIPALSLAIPDCPWSPSRSA